MVLAAGGMVLEILESTAGGFTPRTNLDAWVNTYRLPVSVAIDPPAERVTRTLMTYGIRESLFIVDLRTMRIVNKFNGSVAGLGDSSITMGIARILELLRSGM